MVLRASLVQLPVWFSQWPVFALQQPRVFKRDTKPSSFTTAHEVKATATSIKCKCNLQKSVLIHNTLSRSGLRHNLFKLTCSHRETSQTQRAYLTAFQLLPLFLHFDSRQTQMQGRGGRGATVIGGFPESLTATRAIYECTSVVLTFPGTTPAPLSHSKGTLTKLLWDGAKTRQHMQGCTSQKRILSHYRTINGSDCI